MGTGGLEIIVKGDNNRNQLIGNSNNNINSNIFIRTNTEQISYGVNNQLNKKDKIIKDEQVLKRNGIKEKNYQEENIPINHQAKKEPKTENKESRNIINDINIKESKRFINIINDPFITKNDLDFDKSENKDYIVCLRCKCRNPHIENINFDYNLMDINISYYCACFPEIKPQSQSLELLINSTKPLNLCPIHSNNTLKFYCNICKKFFCEKCKRDTEEHNKDFVNFDKIMSEDIAVEIKKFSFKTQNEIRYKKLINDYLNNLKKIEVPKYFLQKTKILYDNVTAIVLLQSGSIAIGSYDKTISIWNIKVLLNIKKIKVLEKVLALLEFKQDMLLSSHENTICLWDINSDKDECIYKFNGHDSWVNCLVKYDDKIFASASNDHKIIIWDYEQRKIIKKFKLHKDSILALIKLNDGNLCSGGADFAIKILDWKKEKLINNLKGHTNMVKCLCQMDNETLLSGSDDKTIKVWKNYECIFTIEGHSDIVKVLLKLNDNYFVSGSFDNTIKIWDIKTFLSLQTLTDNSSNILCLLKLDNNDLISCSDDKTIKIWGKKYFIN